MVDKLELALSQYKEQFLASKNDSWRQMGFSYLRCALDYGLINYGQYAKYADEVNSW